MAENVIAPPGEFRKLIHLKEDFKLRLLIDICTMFAGALVSDSCYICYLIKGEVSYAPTHGFSSSYTW